jgi:hypothetical protein
MPSATYGPLFLWLEMLSGDELFKDLADLLKRLLLQQSQPVSKFLLLRTGLAAKVETREYWL